MKDVMGNRITFADEDKVSLYGVEMKRVLAAIAFFMSDDPEKWLKNCWVSDMSAVSDFNMDYEDVVSISKILNVAVADNDLLWKVAQAIHEGRINVEA